MLALNRANSLALETGQSLLSRRQSNVRNNSSLRHAPKSPTTPSRSRIGSPQFVRYVWRIIRRFKLVFIVAFLIVYAVAYKPQQTVTRAQQTVTSVKSYLKLQSNNCKPNQEQCSGVGRFPSATTILRNGILSPITFPFDTERQQNDSIPSISTPLFAYSDQPTPVNQISAWPKEIQLPPDAVNTDQLFYSVATSVDRAKEFAKHAWIHFIKQSSKRKPSHCLVLLPPEEITRIEELKLYLQGLGIRCYVKVSAISLYERRFSTMVNETWAIDQEDKLQTKWFLFGDDDTLWLDPIATIRALSAHSPNQKRLLGALTEAQQPLDGFGRLAYGGAGIIFSQALSAAVNSPENWQKCGPDMQLVNSDAWIFPGEPELRHLGGDAMMTYFASIGKGVGFREALDELDGLHQIDLGGEIAGLLQSGKSILSLHHYRSWAWLEPELPEHPGLPYFAGWASIDLMMRVVRALGYDNYRRRYLFDGGKILLVNGFCIMIHKRALNTEELAQVEKTWYNGEPTYPYRANFPDSNDETKFATEHEQQKTVFWIRDIQVDEKDSSRIFMIYETTIGRRIVIEWNPKWDDVQRQMKHTINK